MLAASAAAAVMLTGCGDFGVGNQSMLRPPRATGNEAALQAILSEVVGTSYTLKYPQKGDYRSAVSFFDDIDFHMEGDGSSRQEVEADKKKKYAAAFYSVDNDSRMNISIMARDGQKWKCLGSFSNSGVGVDRIIYADITDDGKGEFIVGWNSYRQEKNYLTVYTVENDSIREMVIDETYTDLMIDDITDDGMKDLMLLSLRHDKSPATVKLLQYDKSVKRPMTKDGVDLYAEINSFQKIAFGKVADTTKTDQKSKRFDSGLVIDSRNNDGRYQTDVICFDKKIGKLVMPLTPDAGEDAAPYENPTSRKEIISSRDINNDGIIEIPVVTDMFSSNTISYGEACSLSTWKQINPATNKLDSKISTVFNYNDGYYYIFPNRWVTRVSCLSDTESRTLTFYMWNSETASLGDKLLEIHRFRRSEWDKAEQNNYVMLLSDQTKGKDYVIAGQIFSTAAKDVLNISKAELERNVKLL